MLICSAPLSRPAGSCSTSSIMISTQSLSSRFQTTANNGRHEIAADAPIDKGGGGVGFSAHELLEASLAVCVNMAVRMYAAEHSIPLESTTTRVRLQRPTPDTVSFEYAVELTGPLSASQLHELQEAARACPVRDTLSKRIEFRATA